MQKQWNGKLLSIHVQNVDGILCLLIVIHSTNARIAVWILIRRNTMKVQYQQNAIMIYEDETRVEEGRVEVLPNIIGLKTFSPMYEFKHHRGYGLYIYEEIL